MVNHYEVSNKKGHRTRLSSKKSKRKGMHSVEFKCVGSTSNRFEAVSMDRMDNNNGYTKDNVRLVRLKCNQGRRCAPCTQGESDVWRGVASNSLRTKPRLRPTSKQQTKGVLVLVTLLSSIRLPLKDQFESVALFRLPFHSPGQQSKHSHWREVFFPPNPTSLLYFNKDWEKTFFPLIAWFGFFPVNRGSSLFNAATTSGNVFAYGPPSFRHLISYPFWKPKSLSASV